MVKSCRVYLAPGSYLSPVTLKAGGDLLSGIGVLSIVGRKLSPFEKIQFRKYLSCDPRTVFGLKHKHILVDAYMQHLEAVRRDIPTEKLLTFDLLDAEKENKLQAFLKSAQKPEFPHFGNQKNKNQLKRISRNFVKRFRY